MNHAFISLLIILLFFATGCAKKWYVHPTKNVQEFEREKYECRNEATLYARNMGFDPLLYMRQGIQECLQARGWVEQREQKHDENINPATKSIYQK